MPVPDHGLEAAAGAAAAAAAAAGGEGTELSAPGFRSQRARAGALGTQFPGCPRADAAAWASAATAAALLEGRCSLVSEEWGLEELPSLRRLGKKSYSPGSPPLPLQCAVVPSVATNVCSSLFGFSAVGKF